MIRSKHREERLKAGEVVHRLMQIFSQQETSRYCDRCDEHILAVRPGTSRVKNILLTMLTCGLWIVMWIRDSRRRPGWRCPRCDQQLG